MSGVDPAVYRRAADVIRERGLAKGTFVIRDEGHRERVKATGDVGSHCAVGAVVEAARPGFRSVMSDASDIVYLYATPLAEMVGYAPGGDSIVSVAEWNDADGRTADDVITLLEQAAEKAEASEVLTP